MCRGYKRNQKTEGKVCGNCGKIGCKKIMPLTAPVPDIAKIVAVYIRQRVPRPKELPNQFRPGDGSLLCWGVNKNLPPSRSHACPLGLLPKAMIGWPTSIKDFRGGVPFSQHELISFAIWWDQQVDALAAVNEVWGDE